jgi:hypothetical protein
MHEQQITLLFQQNLAQQKIIDLLSSTLDENAKKNAAKIESMSQTVKGLEDENKEMSEKMEAL